MKERLFFNKNLINLVCYKYFKLKTKNTFLNLRFQKNSLTVHLLVTYFIAITLPCLYFFCLV